MASYELQKSLPSISRERSPVAVLTDRRNIDIGERDIRLDDYLNDKLQTASDFAVLDSLIASVETQRIQLQDQVSGRFFGSQSGCCRPRNTALSDLMSPVSGLMSVL